MTESIWIALITAIAGPALLVGLNHFFSGKSRIINKLDIIDKRQEKCEHEIAELRESNNHSLKMAYYAAHGTMQLGANGPVKKAVEEFDEKRFE